MGDDINAIFKKAGVAALRNAEHDSAVRAAKAEEKRRADEKKSNAEALLISQIEEARQKLVKTVGELFAEPSEFSKFIDELASSSKRDLNSNFFDVAPLSYIGEPPKRETTLEKAFGQGAADIFKGGGKVYDVPQFKVTYSLINLVTFALSEKEDITLALAVARETHLESIGLEVDIPKYEPVCYQVKRWDGGSLHTENVGFRYPIQELYWAILMLARDKQFFCECVMLNYHKFPQRTVD